MGGFFGFHDPTARLIYYIGPRLLFLDVDPIYAQGYKCDAAHLHDITMRAGMSDEPSIASGYSHDPKIVRIITIYQSDVLDEGDRINLIIDLKKSSMA